MNFSSNRTLLNKVSLLRSSRNRKTVNFDYCLVLAVTGVEMRRITIFVKYGRAPRTHTHRWVCTTPVIAYLIA